MTVRKVWLGSTGPFLYDDSILYIDEDGVISPDNQQAIATDGQIVIQSPPSSPVHAVRKQDLDDALGDISGLEARVDALEATDAALGTMSTQDSNSVSIVGGVIGGAADINTVGSGRVDRLGVGAATPGASGYTYLSGPVGMNGVSPVVNVALGMSYNKISQFGLYIKPVGSDTGNYTMVFVNVAGSVVGSIDATATATAFNTISDVRLKHAITALTGALDVVLRLRPITHLWNADDSRGYGFLAHELQQVIPDAVMGEPDAVNDDGSVKPQQVDHSRLVPWLTAALQETLAQVKVLTERVMLLEQQLGV